MCCAQTFPPLVDGRDVDVGAGNDPLHFAAALLEDRGDDLFRAAVAIDIGGIDEGDAGIERGVEGSLAVGLADLTPGAADLPGAEADLRGFDRQAAKGTIFHDPSP